ncbi:unnamed protein product [Rodentolepis nana]|uniref:Tetraspanin n=1 Tax=Rodentolepis nana TaxID=102285 RepID=A0A158QGP4_RODNA|nr:unnamed protein product [Rodentolepis nana]
MNISLSATSCNPKCLRVFLLVTNIIIFIAGVVISGVGIFLWIKSNELGHGNSAPTIPIFITALGFVSILFGFLGFLGTIKFNKCLLTMMNASIQDFFTQTIAEVETNANSGKEELLKTLQDKFNCCGAYGPNDWKEPQNRCCKVGEANCEGYPTQLSSEGKIAGVVLAGFGIFLLVESNLSGFSGSAILIPIFITIVGLIVLGIAILGYVGAVTLRRSLLLSITGSIMCGYGTYLLVRSKEFGLTGNEIEIPISITIFGLFVLTVGIIGCFSAIKPGRGLLLTFNCCGIGGPTDWTQPAKSCCMPGEQAPCNDYPQQGCGDLLFAWVEYNMLTVGVTVLILSLIEVGAIVAATCLVERRVYT